MPAIRLGPAPAILGVILLWLALGLAGVFFPRNLHLVSRVLFPAGALGALALAVAALAALGGDRAVRWCCRSACPTCRFTCASTRCRRFSCCCSAPRPRGISMFCCRLLPPRRRHRARPALPAVPRVPRQHGAGAARRRRLRRSWWPGRRWRCRRTSSSPPSTASAEIRRAGFLYLLIAHVGAIGILLCFGVLQGGSGDYTFDAMRAAHAARRTGPRSPSASRCSASAPRPACCRCTCGCPKRIRPRPRRCRR